MRPRRFALATVMLTTACAESGQLLVNDAATVPDAPDAVDVIDAAAFDRPQFDVPAVDDARDATEAGNDLGADTASDTANDLTADASADANSDASDAVDARSDASDASATRVDHCYLLDARVASVTPGMSFGPVGVAVRVAAVTAGVGQGAGVTVEVGVGPGGGDPLTAAGWTWTAASFDRDIDGRGVTGAREYDRYQTSPTSPTTEGEYAWAARARVGGGPWMACDLVDTLPHTYAPAFAGRLTVASATAPRAGYCNLQFPRTLSVATGATSASMVYGRVFASGVTNRGCSDQPTAAQLAVQWGYGPVDSIPAGATWTWTDGRYNAHRDSTMPLIEGNCQNIEYSAAPRGPADCAPRHFGWRVRVGTGPWTYCRWAPPAEGAPATPAFDVWDPTLAGTLTVTGCP